MNLILWYKNAWTKTLNLQCTVGDMKGSYIPFDQHDSSTKMVLELLSKECKPLLNATESSVDILMACLLCSYNSSWFFATNSVGWLSLSVFGQYAYMYICMGLMFQMCTFHPDILLTTQYWTFCCHGDCSWFETSSCFQKSEVRLGRIFLIVLCCHCTYRLVHVSGFAHYVLYCHAHCYSTYMYIYHGPMYVHVSPVDSKWWDEIFNELHWS